MDKAVSAQLYAVEFDRFLVVPEFPLLSPEIVSVFVKHN